MVSESDPMETLPEPIESRPASQAANVRYWNPFLADQMVTVPLPRRVAYHSPEGLAATSTAVLTSADRRNRAGCCATATAALAHRESNQMRQIWTRHVGSMGVNVAR